jgi:hypothetical protein
MGVRETKVTLVTGPGNRSDCAGIKKYEVRTSSYASDLGHA